MFINDLFLTLARENKRIKAFKYGKTAEKGAGNDIYPLIWLDDPIYAQSAGQTVPQSALRWIPNVDILGVPTGPDDVVNVQNAALFTGLGIIERINDKKAEYGYSVESFNMVSLSEYYDDDAAGWRFTYTLKSANPADRCADDWDTTKQLVSLSPLPDIDTVAPGGCVIFNRTSLLPNFNVK